MRASPLKGLVSRVPLPQFCKFSDVCDFVDHTCESAAHTADRLADRLSSSHGAAARWLPTSIRRKLLGSIKLAARATQGVSDEVVSLVKLARMAAELVEARFMSCKLSDIAPHSMLRGQQGAYKEKWCFREYMAQMSSVLLHRQIFLLLHTGQRRWWPHVRPHYHL